MILISTDLLVIWVLNEVGPMNEVEFYGGKLW